MADAVIEPPTTAPADAEPPQARGPISGFQQWYMVVALMVLSLVAALDRTSLSLIAPMIKADLNLTDTELSLLLGLSFVLFHTLTAVPMGWMVDRFSRKWILGVGAALWSLATFGSGLATNFWQLFVGRAGVGFSEGGLQPAGFSLIRDGVDPGRRGRAFSIHGTGALLGPGVSFMAAGLLIGAIGSGSHVLPLIGEVRPWQLMLIILGLAGLPFALLAVPIAEPPRPANHRPEPFIPGYATAFGYMTRHWRLYLPVILFMSLMGMMGGAYNVWLASVVNRNFGVPLSHLGAQLGLALIVCFPIGMMGAGVVIDLMRKRGLRLAAGYMGLVATLITTGPQTFMPLAPTLPSFWIATYVSLLTLAMALPVGINLMATITPKGSAGRVQAIYILLQAIIGQALGPFLVGNLSDTVFAWAGHKSLGYALASCSAVFMTLALLCIVWMLRELKHATLPEE